MKYPYLLCSPNLHVKLKEPFFKRFYRLDKYCPDNTFFYWTRNHELRKGFIDKNGRLLIYALRPGGECNLLRIINNF